MIVSCRISYCDAVLNWYLCTSHNHAITLFILYDNINGVMMIKATKSKCIFELPTQQSAWRGHILLITWKWITHLEVAFTLWGFCRGKFQHGGQNSQSTWVRARCQQRQHEGSWAKLLLAILDKPKITYMWPDSRKPSVWDPHAICAIHVFNSSDQNLFKTKFCHIRVKLSFF